MFLWDSLVCRVPPKEETRRPSRPDTKRSSTRAVGMANLRSLQIYRRFLRAARAWENAEEARWIRQEARALFEEARGVTNPSTVSDLQNAAEDRLAMALHYKIPYARPDHFGGGGGEGLSKHKERAAIARGRKRVNVNGATKWIATKWIS